MKSTIVVRSAKFWHFCIIVTEWDTCWSYRNAHIQVPQYIKYRDDANAKYIIALNEAKLLRKSGDSTHSRL